MTDVPTYVRRVATRVLGPQSPTIDLIVDEVVGQIIQGLRAKTLPLADMKSFAKRATEVAATASYAAARKMQSGPGRSASMAACRTAAAAARADSVRELLATLAQAPVMEPVSTDTRELTLVA